MVKSGRPSFIGTRHPASGRTSSESAILTESTNKVSTGNRFAVCVNNDGHPASLELHEIYRVLPDEGAKADEDLRIVDESGVDYLYPAERFILLELPQAVEESLLQNA